MEEYSGTYNTVNFKLHATWSAQFGGYLYEKQNPNDNHANEGGSDIIAVLITALVWTGHTAPVPDPG